MTDPRFLVALFVLAANDHWWKHSYPSWLTGKLSDIAGLVVLPVVAMAIIGLTAHAARRKLPVDIHARVLATIAAWFTAMKTSPIIAGWTEQVFSALTWRDSTIVVDTTDLIGLTGLVVAWFILDDPISIRAGVLSHRPTFVRSAILVVAAFFCTAASLDEPSHVVDPVSDTESSDGSIRLR